MASAISAEYAALFCPTESPPPYGKINGAVERSRTVELDELLTLKCGRLGTFDAQRLFSRIPAPIRQGPEMHSGPDQLRRPTKHRSHRDVLVSGREAVTLM